MPRRSRTRVRTPRSAAALSVARASWNLRLGPFEVGQRQLDVRLSIVLVLIEGERDVDGGLVLSEVVVTLGGAPRDGAEDAAILLERHLEVALFEPAWPVHDLDAAG